jgi:hypothetical protein
MDNDADLELLQQYLQQELNAEEEADCERRLASEPSLAALLLRLAEEDVALRQWVAERESSRSFIQRALRRRFYPFDFRSFAFSVSLVVVPPLLLAFTAWLRNDMGLGVAAWGATMHRIIEQTAGAIGAASTCCWLGVRHLGWLRHPMLAALSSVGILLGTTWMGQAAIARHVNTDQRKLAQLFQNETWVSYDSAYYWPEDLKDKLGHAFQEPTEAQIRQELKLLREAGFTALYLHESRVGQRNVPRLAREAGFRGIVMTIRIGTPKQLSSPELRTQIETANAASPWVDAFCLGEVTAREVDLAELKQLLAELRASTKKPVTTSFLDDEYFGRRGARLRELADFTIRGLHHHWKTQPSVEQALRRMERAYESFREDESPALLTFVGFPSGGHAAWSEKSQEEFLVAATQSLRAPTGTNCVLYTSFDLPWQKRYAEVHEESGPNGRFGLYATEPRAGTNELSFRPKVYLRQLMKDKAQ